MRPDWASDKDCKKQLQRKGNLQVTRFTVLERFGNYTSTESWASQNRSQRTRFVCMAYIGHPVAGDPLGYARPLATDNFYMLRPLVCHILRLGELVEFTAEEPAIFKEPGEVREA